MTKNTKERPDQFDGHLKARPNEITFTLLERDPCAPPAILHWVALRREAALKIEKEKDRKAELRQITNAEEIAWSMMERPAGDRPVEPTIAKSYSGLSVERNPVEDLIGEMRAAIREADYHAKLAEEKLAELVRLDPANDLAHLDEQLLRATRSAHGAIHEIAIRMTTSLKAGAVQAALPMESDDV